MEKKVILYFSTGFLFLFSFYFLFLAAPEDFPVGSVIRVEKGSSLRKISLLLKDDHVIKSRTVFEAVVILSGGEKSIQSADYLFEEKESVFTVGRRIANGDHNMPQVSVTIPEGFDRNQISETFALKLTNFNKTQFLVKTKTLEGYLFPDTYFFLTNATEDDVITSMSDNFSKKVSKLSDETEKNEIDIIKMASLIEREAKGDADRAIISGILWKRISMGMALQADAAPETYQTRGLPKNPICNPGVESITASIHPQSSPYLYYLHDEEGNIHFAKNFTEHLQNKANYLK